MNFPIPMILGMANIHTYIQNGLSIFRVEGDASVIKHTVF